MDVLLPLKYQEQDLISACASNERWAQQYLYETYYSSLMSVCLRYAATSDEGLDMLHEGFIKIFKNISKYQPGTSLGAWMHRLMVNNCIDQYRKMQRRRTEDIEHIVYVSSSEADAVSQCTEQDILQAVQQLPPAYRAVFNMYVMEGFSHKEIGEALNITESTSRSNLVKARTKLRAWLSGLAFNSNDETHANAGS